MQQAMEAPAVLGKGGGAVGAAMQRHLYGLSGNSAVEQAATKAGLL
jgi:hypothetical protein